MPKEPKLDTYVWHGTNAKGETLTGEIAAASLILAKAEIRRQGINIKTVNKKSQGLFSGGKGKKLSAADVSIILRQTSTMINAGIPIVQALDMLGQAQTNPTGKTVIQSIKADIESGTQFAKSLRKYPQYFSSLTCNLLEAGEQSGSLDKMLDRVATYNEKTESLKKRIKKALTYPAAVIGIAILITIGLLIYVVPTFKDVFKSFNAELPTPTLVVIALSDFMKKFWWLFLGGSIGGIYAIVQAYKKNPKFEEKLDRFSLKLPILGAILEKAAIARFARTLSTTFAAGLPLVDALQTVAGATGNVLFSKATLKIREDVSAGQKIHRAMSDTHLFPPLVVQMVGIGEESGSLEFMLAKVADFYEEDVDNAVDNLSSLLEPLIMVVLGTLIGGLVVAMYLPIFKLGGIIH